MPSGQRAGLDWPWFAPVSGGDFQDLGDVLHGGRRSVRDVFDVGHRAGVEVAAAVAVCVAQHGQQLMRHQEDDADALPYKEGG